MPVPELTYYNIGRDVLAFSTTRRGGCSSGAYESFNINAFCGDEDSNIEKNRTALCQFLNIDATRLIIPHQIHETVIREVSPSYFSLSDAEKADFLEGVDAVMTDMQGICVGVSTADCIPVLLYDEPHHAIAAIHAGWRGTVKRIVEHAIAAMHETYQTDAIHLKSVIGPGISMESFEVGDEVFDAFSQAGFDMEKISCKSDKWHINLPECNRLQLINQGIPESSIVASNVCTYKNVSDYFSARRLGIKSGRIYTGILLKKEKE